MKLKPDLDRLAAEFLDNFKSVRYVEPIWTELLHIGTENVFTNLFERRRIALGMFEASHKRCCATSHIH